MLLLVFEVLTGPLIRKILGLLRYQLRNIRFRRKPHLLLAHLHPLLIIRLQKLRLLLQLIQITMVVILLRLPLRVIMTGFLYSALFVMVDM